MSSIYPGDLKTQIELLSVITDRNDICYYCSNNNLHKQLVRNHIFFQKTIFFSEKDNNISNLIIPYNSSCIIFGKNPSFMRDESFLGLSGRKHIIFDNFVPKNIEFIKDFCYRKDIVIHISGDNIPEIFPYAKPEIQETELFPTFKKIYSVIKNGNKKGFFS